MSHEHRQDPERFYDDEVPGYGDPSDWPVLDLGDFYDQADDDHAYDAMRWPVPLSVAAKTWTFTPKAPEPMTRRQTYRHCMDSGWSRRDSILAALLSDEQRPEHYDHRPMFTMERPDGE